MSANQLFQPVRQTGWRLGFANMLRKENRLWWGTRRWLVQAGLWLVVLNGFVALILFILPGIAETNGEIPNGVEILFNLGMPMLSLGTIILCQGMIVDEKTSGTGEWVLSKPLSRSAFLLAKLIGNGLGILAVLVGLQSLVAYILIWVASGEFFPVLPFLMGVGVMALQVLFYLTLTMLVGVFVESRGVVLAIPLGVLFGGALLAGFVGDVAFLMPWPLADMVPLMVMGRDLPGIVYVSIAMTAFWTVLFILLALWKFERVEF